MDAVAVRQEDSMRDRLSTRSLAYHAERGRDPLDIILDIAFKLGEQRGCEACHEAAYPLALALRVALTSPDVSMPDELRELFESCIEMLSNPGNVGALPRQGSTES